MYKGVTSIKSYTAEYACISSTGYVRRNNEDNFFCAGSLRGDVNSTEEVSLSGAVDSSDNELFAVFDGMGGEACGEVASFAAADHARSFTENKGDYEEYLYELAELMNEKVREETEARSLVLMGTTAAMLQLSGDEIYILNAGDSRIYKLSGHKLRQISVDHTAPVYGGKALTKFIGLPQGHSLSPYIASGKCKAGDLYLLCSDGVTDMLSDDEISAILDSRKTAAQLCREIVDAALTKGGVDNTTAIVLRINK